MYGTSEAVRDEILKNLVAFVKQKQINKSGKLDNSVKVWGKDYFDNLPIEKKVKYIENRFNKMEKSKLEENLKIKVCKDLCDQALQEYKIQNTLKRPYRSARFFQVKQKWIDKWVENMPQCSLKTSSYRDSNAAEKAKGIEKSIESLTEETNENDIKTQIFDDALSSGTGILSIDYSSSIKNILPLRVDPRDFYLDENCDSINNAKDCIWARKFYFHEFNEDFAEFEIGEVKFKYENKQSGDKKSSPNYYTRSEILEKKNDEVDKAFVWVYVYDNKILGKRFVVANNIIIHEEDLPKDESSNAMLPFSLYYWVKNNESPWGIALIQAIAPEVFALENFTELAFRNAKARLQKMIIGDGDVGFHTGLKQQPNGIWVLNNLSGRNVRETFSEIELGGVPGEFFSMHNLFLDNLTVASKVDQRALMANPNQLATQTNRKKESFEESVRTVIKRTLWTSEKRTMELKVSFFKSHIVPLRKSFDIEGYFVIRGDKKNPTFIKDSAGKGIYRATGENTNVKVRVNVISQNKKFDLDNDQQDRFLKSITAWGNTMSTILPILQSVDPEEAKKVVSKFDFVGMTEEFAEIFGRDKSKWTKDSEERGVDAVEQEQKRFRLGFPVVPSQDEKFDDALSRIQMHIEFLKEYDEELSSKSKNLVIDNITKTYEYLLYNNDGSKREMPEEEINQAMQMTGQGQPNQMQASQMQANNLPIK